MQTIQPQSRDQRGSAWPEAGTGRIDAIQRETRTYVEFNRIDPVLSVGKGFEDQLPDVAKLIVKRMKPNNKIVSSDIQNMMFAIRGVQVMLNRDLAVVDGVETKVLNQEVKRNIDPFPLEFRLQLPEASMKYWSRIMTGSI